MLSPVLSLFSELELPALLRLNNIYVNLSSRSKVACDDIRRSSTYSFL